MSKFCKRTPCKRVCPRSLPFFLTSPLPSLFSSSVMFFLLSFCWGWWQGGKWTYWRCSKKAHKRTNEHSVDHWEARICLSPDCALSMGFCPNLPVHSFSAQHKRKVPQPVRQTMNPFKTCAKSLPPGSGFSNWIQESPWILLYPRGFNIVNVLGIWPDSNCVVFFLNI